MAVTDRGYRLNGEKEAIAVLLDCSNAFCSPEIFMSYQIIQRSKYEVFYDIEKQYVRIEL